MNEPDKKWEPFLYISFDDRWMASPWFGEILWNVCRPLIQLQWELSSERKRYNPRNLFFFFYFSTLHCRWQTKKEYFAYNCFHFNDRMSQENESILAFLLKKYLFEFLISVTVVHFFKCARASKFNATSSSPDNKKGSERCMISFFQLHTTISCLVVHLKLLNKAFIRFFQWSLPLGKGDPSAL